jgi:hypothetical protein
MEALPMTDIQITHTGTEVEITSRHRSATITFRRDIHAEEAAEYLVWARDHGGLYDLRGDAMRHFIARVYEASCLYPGATVEEAE